MITFQTQNPYALLSSLREGIRGGRIVTWAEQDGYLTHSPSQWAKRAWLLPSVGTGVLRFAIIKPKNQGITKEVYAVYHGRFLETMLAHFDSEFSDGYASAMPTALDRVAA